MFYKYIHYPITDRAMRKLIIDNEIELGELLEAPFNIITGGYYA
jgi:hypothetical protein